MKHNLVIRSLQLGTFSLAAGATLAAIAQPGYADPIQSTGARLTSNGYTPTSLPTAMLTPSANQSAASKGQQVQPRWSLAESAPSSRISLVMSSMHGGADYHSRVTMQRPPVASYPLSFGTSVGKPRTLVATIALTHPIIAGTGATATLPKTAVRVAINTPNTPGSATQSSPSHSARTLLAELDAEQRRLDSADAYLSEGQRQLGRFADTLRQAMMEAGPDATGLHPFVRVAQRYAGTPYVWGGESARGFDCSGFIIRVMRDLGYHALPHSAAEQFTYGKPIAQALLKPGDLVFFANTYKPGISHVGIYLGKRRFIHAAGTGKGTIVSILDDAHYQAHYAGARRLIAAQNE